MMRKVRSVTEETQVREESEREGRRKATLIADAGPRRLVRTCGNGVLG